MPTPSLLTGYRPARAREVSRLVQMLSEPCDRLFFRLSSKDVVQAAAQFLTLEPLSPDSTHRTVVITCDHATILAQGALLRILEEPPPKAAFILECEDPSSLLETIRSRCVCLNFTTQSYGQIVADLVQGGQAMASAAFAAVQLARGFSTEVAPDERAFSIARSLIEAAKNGQLELALKVCEEFDGTVMSAVRVILMDSKYVESPVMLRILSVSTKVSEPSRAAVLVLSELVSGSRGR